ncbi:outer membrane lipoprotein carrier protein LolA [Cognatiyoonia sp. IB215446]|uniref:LolA family protein n=1 Tax=Cognatiyoonia sp. IB215446 TaxID=3097355 RepID=UPI002A1558C0|nr:outer membrane lipoprotein carrier protein LolA [Cognatiyoonia sp. IB215446]MDX8347822.1 outer membrane lipoprotein carrier protein LolA [Cognatiyoonia sp. IB215446]
MSKRILYLAMSLMLAFYAGAASAQQLSLAQISQYLNGLQTARGGFTQINQDGTLSTGQIFIKRPGRIRFEYNPPNEALVLASGGQLAVFDPRSNVPPDRFPLNQTPLGIILQDNVNLGRERMVTNQTSDGTTTTITAQDPDNPQYGNIQLVFTANPIELRQWIVTDEFGTQTTVIMNDLVTGGSIRDQRFNIISEMRDRGF